ncbi:hypothetical protein DTO013E5_246 [Penicillium roqueforti]|nr:CAZyme family CE10 [Penicillium roqueforti]KAF9250349.1 CAZyme family CE10 [Penicillium roqueforti]KAI1833037.1 hypothetical protein CBS147337_5994 [Penicillium roqueforti]KAI2671650.1 hypothetical protein CBS147355_8642 [Penicillium roqueforti]KAI2682721.1 hypothetical protein LCP963914a_6212 [Penicillium roqueforti]KAI2703382.1 hypothetical protein CBS147372_3697 [Penicillium roqueforti]
MPYAQAPIGDLRFHYPRSINVSWNHIQPALEYGPHCIGYGDHQEQFKKSEDCLTLNVVRPSSYKQGLLPVGVFIYGGGRHGGGSGDGRYNLSYLISHAAEENLSFIGVSFNYRSSIWGFISGDQIKGTRNTNLGLHDQRLALHWVQENIEAFGGDKSRVTIWGGSSGADSVGLHLTAYGGRDDGLFRAAIMQSGGPIVKTSYSSFTPEEMYQRLSVASNCKDVENSLECLRHIPLNDIDAAFNDSAQANSQMMASFAIPTLDGNFVEGYGSLAITERRYVPVPILSGIVSSEAATWIPPQISTWKDLAIFLTEDSGYPSSVSERLLSYYPESGVAETLEPPIGSISDKDTFERVKTVIGDIEMNAAQRLVCESFSTSATCFNFIFNATPAWQRDSRVGVPHGAEIAPIFQNLDGLGFDGNSFHGKGPGYYEMSSLMGTMWAGFITTLDPNAGLKQGVYNWPKYESVNRDTLVFDEVNVGLTIQDTYRADALRYISENFAGVFDK